MLRLWPDMRGRKTQRNQIFRHRVFQSKLRWCGLTRVLVSADRLYAEHWSAGVQAKRAIAHAVLDSHEPLAFKTAMADLVTQLPATSWQRLEVYLADQHVHLMLLPAIQQAGQSLSIAEQNAYARALLLKTYGEAAAQWPFRMQYPLQSQASLLAAIPVLQNMTAHNLVAPRKYLQVSIQPYACALWAQTRLPAEGSVICAEPHMLRLLQLQGGEVIHVASLLCDLNDSNSMAAWLLRERTLLGVQTAPCYWLSEPACVAVAATGRRLSQHLAGQLPWKTLYSNNKITSLWQEVAHVA